LNQQLLTDLLIDEERHAPDPGAVLAGARLGIRRRRRRNRVSAVLAATVAIAAVVAAFAAVPRGGAPVAGVPTWTVHIRLTWLPEGVPADPFLSVGRHGELASYGEQEAGPYLIAALDPPARPDSDWTKTTVNGLPGWYESSPLWTRVAWTLPSGRSATLEYGNIGTRTPTLERDALRAAAALRDDGNRVLRPAVTPGYLPAGLALTGAASDGGISLEGDGTTAIRVTLADPSVGNGLSTGQTKDHTGNTPIRVRDVQGHRAYAGGQHLYVVDYHGRTLTLSGGGMPIPSGEELLRTAEGLRWTGAR
jgi:hypothetical protein